MSDYFLNRVTLTDDGLSLVMTSLDLTIQSFEKVLDQRGHNNMSIND